MGLGAFWKGKPDHPDRALRRHLAKHSKNVFAITSIALTLAHLAGT